MRSDLVFACALTCAIVCGGVSVYRGLAKFDRLTARVATLEARNAELRNLCAAQAEALERIKAESAAQTERLAKAQSEAARTRAKSEARVQTILAAPTPDTDQELAAWAAREAKELNGRLR